MVNGFSGVFGQDGSRLVNGYGTIQDIILNQVEAANSMAVSKESPGWNEYNAGHATMAARLMYVMPSFRLMLAADTAAAGGLQTADRGPRLAAAGTISGGSRVIRIPYALHGGSALRAVGISFSNPAYSVDTASSAELASLFGVYAGVGSGFAHGTPINIDGAAINASAGTIDLTLSGNAGVTDWTGAAGAMPSAFTVHYLGDYGVSNPALGPAYGPYGPSGQYSSPTRAAMLCDDRVDATLGIPFGWHMRPALNIAISTV